MPKTHTPSYRRSWALARARQKKIRKEKQEKEKEREIPADLADAEDTEPSYRRTGAPARTRQRKKNKKEDKNMSGKTTKERDTLSLLNAVIRWKRRKRKDEIRRNKTPKCIMRSAVPLSCYFDAMISQWVAGQRPR